MKKILHKITIAVVDIISLMCYHLTGTSARNKAKLASLKDKYQGRRCFVVCNGPSLRAEDLTKIHENGDISMGMNMVANVYDKTPWRPTFYSATDDCVFDPKNRELVENAECGIKLYEAERFLKTRNAKGNLLFLRFNGSEKLLDEPEFAIDATKKLPSIGTSTYSLTEFMIYTGCKEIYIIGCDNSFAANLHRDGTITYNDAGQNHFYAKDKDFLSQVKPIEIWKLDVAFEHMAKWAKENNVKIYNATRGGRLEAFPRVDFDSLF